MTFPVNDVETLLIEVAEDRLDVGAFLSALFDGRVWVPLSIGGDDFAEIRAVDHEGSPFVRVFTSQEQALEVLPDRQFAEVSPRDLIARGPVEWGLAINPGTDLGFTVSAATLRQL